jgi:hypothetical protein
MSKLTHNDLVFLRSQSDSDLIKILSQLSKSEQQEAITALLMEPDSLPTDEREKQRQRQAERRARERDLIIPLPADMERRSASLADPETFLTTYFASTFCEEFTVDRRSMLSAIVDAAKYGKDIAIAGPRGEGKTKLAMYGALYLMFARLSTFPLVIGKSQVKAANELETIKDQLQQNELLIADFPEIGVPFKAVGAWSSRARMQTVEGEYTNLRLSSHMIAFPTIDLLGNGWSQWRSHHQCEPVSAGQVMMALGVDGPIRGTNYRDRRPTLAILDDIESRESAQSDALIEANEMIIEKDVAGLGTGSSRVSRVMLCTTQNRKCIAYRYTNTKEKPSWNGKRYRRMIEKPAREDLWQRYIELRRNKANDDPEAREATRFYVENRDEMDRDVVMSNRNSYDKRIASDGELLELSAVQSYFNAVADFGAESVATEQDNDPPATVGPEGSGLSSNLVASRLNSFERFQVPDNTRCIVAGLDVGKYVCHYVITAWTKDAAGCVIDYGVAEVSNSAATSHDSSVEQNIYRTLLDFREWIIAQPFENSSGDRVELSECFVDSGAYTQAVYQFVKDAGGGRFTAVKGMAPYRTPANPSDTMRIGNEVYAAYQKSEHVWLHHINTDYWKRFVHERFLSPTYDANEMLRSGSLSIFHPAGSKQHYSYAQHVVAEEWVSEFKQGKGERCYWMVHNRNNHWLDATAMAAAAAGKYGVSMIADAAKAKLKATPRSQAVARVQAVRAEQRKANARANWINRARRR